MAIIELFNLLYDNWKMKNSIKKLQSENSKVVRKEIEKLETRKRELCENTCN